MADVTMPQLGETVTEGTITKWMKAVGETVARDEPLFEVSTDKVDSEVPSPAAGVLQEILVPEGETVEVGARLAVIGESAGASAAPAQASPATEPTPGPPEQALAPPPSPAFTSAAAPSAPPVPTVAPSAPPVPTVAPSAPPVPTVAPTDAGQFAPPAPSAPLGEGNGAAAKEAPPLLSPVVRRLLDENGIDPAQVTGTGLGGRITREDVLAAIDARRAGAGAATSVAPTPPVGAPTPPAAWEQRPPQPPTAPEWSPAASAPAHRPAVPTAQPDVPVVAFRSSEDRVIPFSNVRRRTAENMVRSKATSPHAFIATEADFENVERIRKVWGPRFRAEEGFSLTYLPFIARACVEALREYPNLNASVVEDSLVVHPQIHLGIAVDLYHEGLIVPVVHRAEEVTLRGIARRIRDLADRARSRQLQADDIAGGTFSVTNDGPFGTYFTVPIINQPQVAILATDGIKRRPVVVTLPDGSESIAIHSVGILGVSWDHRAVDGAYVSAFLGRMTEILVTRDWTAEL